MAGCHLINMVQAIVCIVYFRIKRLHFGADILSGDVHFQSTKWT